MKRIISILAAFAVMTMFALCGCQKQEGQTPAGPGSAPTSSAPTATGSTSPSTK